MARLTFIDSLRAIAITAVAGFHYFALWCAPIRPTTIYPYGSGMAFIGFQYGFFGVYLFFLVSGLVITLTLESCRSYGEFLVKRFARLWPALVACTALVYALQLTPWRMPELSPHLADLVPSLTTVEPKLLSALGLRGDYVIGSVWTLFVEVRFYILAGLGYFMLPKRLFVPGLLAFAALAMAAAVARGTLDGAAGAVLTSVALVRSIGWFALGAFCLKLHRGTQTGIETALAGLNWIGVTALFYTFPPRLSASLDAPAIPCAALACAIPGLFAALMLAPSLQRRLERRALVVVGAASYSLYLLHEVVGLAVIARIPAALPFSAQIGLVGLVYAGLIGLAHLVFRVVEEPGREAIRRTLLGDRRPTHEWLAANVGRRVAG